MHTAVGEVAKQTMENVQQTTKEVGKKGGFDIPGETSSFGTQDLSKGETGKSGTDFDGPWDRKNKKTEALEARTQEAGEPNKDFQALGEFREGDKHTSTDLFQNLDAKVNDYNEELAQTSVGGEYREVQPENLQKKSPDEIAESRRQFGNEKSRLIDQWEHTNNREWPRYDDKVTTKDGKIIRKVGDKFDAHHVQPLELGGQNTTDNLTPMHASDHYDKQGIHRPEGPYDTMVKTIKEA